MPSKQCIDRQRASTVVESAVFTSGPQVADKAVARLAAGAAGSQRTDRTPLTPRMETEPPPDLPRFLRLMALSLVQSRVRLVEADIALSGVRREAAVQRDRRDRALARLRPTLASLRLLWRDRHPCPARPGPLRPGLALREADDVLRVLRQPETVDALRMPMVHLDHAILVAELETARRELHEAIDAINTLERRAIAALADLREATADHDATYRRVLRLFQALLDAAGMAELAGHVRPAKRRRSRTPHGAPSARRPAQPVASARVRPPAGARVEDGTPS